MWGQHRYTLPWVSSRRLGLPSGELLAAVGDVWGCWSSVPALSQCTGHTGGAALHPRPGVRSVQSPAPEHSSLLCGPGRRVRVPQPPSLLFSKLSAPSSLSCFYSDLCSSPSFPSSAALLWICSSTSAQLLPRAGGPACNLPLQQQHQQCPCALHPPSHQQSPPDKGGAPEEMLLEANTPQSLSARGAAFSSPC